MKTIPRQIKPIGVYLNRIYKITATNKVAIGAVKKLNMLTSLLSRMFRSLE